MSYRGAVAMTRERVTAIGVDIGATTTRVGLVACDGRLLSVRSAPTPEGLDAAGLLAALLCDDVEQQRPDAGDDLLAAIGLAVPGLVDAATNTIRRAVNLPFLEGDWLVRRLATASGVPIGLHTDIAAATWAEYRACTGEAHTESAEQGGMAKPAEGGRRHEHATDRQNRFVHLRLGSGIGLGVILEGKPAPVEPDRMTHARVLVVDERDDAPACSCGLRGCLELYAGGKALVAAARSIGIDGGLAELEQAVAAGDVAAMELLDATAGVILRVVDNITRRYEADVIVVGGGVIEHLPSLWRRLAAASGRPARAGAGPSPAVAHAQCGDAAGVIGAALLAWPRS